MEDSPGVSSTEDSTPLDFEISDAFFMLEDLSLGSSSNGTAQQPCTEDRFAPEGYRGITFIEDIVHQLEGWIFAERIHYWNLRAEFWDRKKEESLARRDAIRSEIKIRKLERKFLGINISARSPISKAPLQNKKANRNKAKHLLLSGFA